MLGMPRTWLILPRTISYTSQWMYTKRIYLPVGISMTYCNVKMMIPNSLNKDSYHCPLLYM